MNLLDSHSSFGTMIEPLEQRIAPALLVSGANLLGAGNPTTGQTSIGGNSVTLVKVLTGDAIVWYSQGQITAISVGPNTTLDITGDVGHFNAQGVFIPGPIIGNLTASGKLSDSDGNPANGLDGDLLLPNNILGITTHPLSNEAGTIGNIITGGSVSNVNVAGNLSGIFAGDGAFYSANGNSLLDSHVLSAGSVSVSTFVDVNPIQPGIQGGFVFSASNAATVESGASITNVKVGGAEAMQLFAGDGFAGTSGHAGQAGGSVSNVTIESAFVNASLNVATPNAPTFDIMAGSGGNGVKGGAGGSIQNINEVSSSGAVDILAGHGGTGAGGAGGVGGSIKSLNMESDGSAYTVTAGKGGDGAPGGAGGSVKGVNFGGDQLTNGIVVAAPFTGNATDDILLINAQSGSMIIEQNNGHGTGFTPVVQYDGTVDTISPEGTGPVAAVAVNLGNGREDIVVAYKDSDNIGIYTNQGGGVFYSGLTLEATSLSLGANSPTTLAAGNFTGNVDADLALTVNDSSAQSELMVLTGTGGGNFNIPSSLISIPTGAVSLIPADIQGGSYSDLFVGFKSGLIDALLSTGSNGTPFTVVTTGTTVSGGLANLDYNPQEGLLLALNGSGDTINLYESSNAGALSQISSISLSSETGGTALVAHFVPETQSAAEPIEVLSSVGSGSRLDLYSQGTDTFTLTASVTSTEALKNFAPVLSGSTFGVAAVGSTVGHFAFSQNSGAFYDVEVPFPGSVALTAGDGGNGIGSQVAAGGAGGMVSGMSVVAEQIVIQAGNGGSSINAAAGAGGMVADTPVLLTYTGQSVQTILQADTKLIVDAGDGGTATGTVHNAAGGDGGKIQGLNLSLLENDIQVTAGYGGNGGGGAGGSGGSVTALKSLASGGDLDVIAGNGGSALGSTGNGGAGGSITELTHTLTPAAPADEIAYNVILLAGTGGQSLSANGGAGGSIETVKMTLQPPNESVNNSNGTPVTVHANADSTVRITVTAGSGGDGAKGGAGGELKNISSTSVFEQTVTVPEEGSSGQQQFPEINPVAAVFISGGGGTGSKGAGGAGGAINGLNLVGITNYDADKADSQAGDSPLVIISGGGGSGATAGGAGGAIANVSSSNSEFILTGQIMVVASTELTGATVISGAGGGGGIGNGGAGGAISNLSIGVAGLDLTSELITTNTQAQNGGELTVLSGAGGGGGVSGKGGAGGSISGSLLGCTLTYEQYGLILEGGVGGSGGLGGGVGGNVTKIQLNAPQNSEPAVGTYDVISTLILAGNGGAGTGASSNGGVGGSVSQISESKDINTPINLLQAGNGGAGTKTGGAGGSVTSVNTVGLIGQASDDSGNSIGVFQTYADPGYFDNLFAYGQVPQGVFAGVGGTGPAAGINGSVTNITAAQIAAIGAAVNASGYFAAAAKVANITAESVAYDVNGNGVYENQTGFHRTAPNLAVPIDGFIFSETTPTGINTLDNTALTAFTFVA